MWGTHPFFQYTVVVTTLGSICFQQYWQYTGSVLAAQLGVSFILMTTLAHQFLPGVLDLQRSRSPRLPRLDLILVQVAVALLYFSRGWCREKKRRHAKRVKPRRRTYTPAETQAETKNTRAVYWHSSSIENNKTNKKNKQTLV